MKITKLAIHNFRAIERFEIEDIRSFVVIAGGNGSGKSCVLDAIRLLKSSYGGYGANEHQQWFGEFAINLEDRTALAKILRDASSPLNVRATIEFAEAEREYLRSNAADIALTIAWERVTGQQLEYGGLSRASVAARLDQLRPTLDPIINSLVSEALVELSNTNLELAVTIAPDGETTLLPCAAAQLAFRAREDADLGVIEYHSASRNYARQDLGGIVLDSSGFAEQRRQHRLYNSQAKYQNLKTELASDYLRSLVSSQLDSEDQSPDDLNDTLDELFRTFFPDKKYSGPKPLPGGRLSFPVELTNGASHDIDDLSSGEKEILFGYLRMRNSTPKKPVVLIDEPELHLNPVLLHGFADFYFRHLGIAKNTQIWLVTHSDTLLRQAVGNSKYTVVHMTPASAQEVGVNQAIPVHLNDEIDRTVVDLVGDLAAYRPHAKVLILEGEGSEGFDVTFVRRLFPEIAAKVNLVSGGSKKRVSDLFATLSQVAAQAGLENRFFAVTDRDRDSTPNRPNQWSWDRYHIENYLLEPEAVLSAIRAVDPQSSLTDSAAVRAALQQCANQLVGPITVSLLRDEVDRRFVSAISIAGNPESTDPAADLSPSIEATVNRLRDLSELNSPDSLRARADVLEAELRASLTTEDWMKEFPGRLVLKRFVDDHVPGVNYPAFANLILDRLAESRSEPEGMKSILELVIAA